MIEKVTAFITRDTPQGRELLLFEHPFAGNQIPAGTVEEDEPAEVAVLREAIEETGLPPSSLERVSYLGQCPDPLPAGCTWIGRRTTVYARPDPNSFDWAYFRRGLLVKPDRRANGFVQVTFIEHDREPDPQYVTYQITGWVPADALTDTQMRHFYHLRFRGTTEARWTVDTDKHRFTLFWAGVDALPPIIVPQDQWLDFLPLEAQPSP